MKSAPSFSKSLDYPWVVTWLPACNAQSHLLRLLPPSSQHLGGEVGRPENCRKCSPDLIKPKASKPFVVQAVPAFPPPRYQDLQSGGYSRMWRCTRCTPWKRNEQMCLFVWSPEWTVSNGDLLLGERAHTAQTPKKSVPPEKSSNVQLEKSSKV